MTADNAESLPDILPIFLSLCEAGRDIRVPRFASDRSGILAPVIAQTQLSADDIKNVSQYFAAQKYRIIPFKADPARVETSVAQTLSDEDIIDLAHYIANLP